MKYTANSGRYDSMKYIRLGKSGLKTSAIAFGMWQNFGGASQYDNCLEMIRTAFDLGITYFDLANNYGGPPGFAEENFGKILKQDFGCYRDEMIITSKAGHRMWEGPYGFGSCKKSLVSSIDQSLKRVGVDYFDIFFSHRFDEETPLEETFEALDLLVKQGKALYIGVSSGYNEKEMEEVVKITKRLGTPLVIHMARYSMFNRELEGGLQDLLTDEGIGSMAFSPLAEGALTDKYLTGIPENSKAERGGKYTSSKEGVDKVNALNELAKKRGQTLAQMAISWALREEKVQCALLGASSAAQIRENVKALNNLEFCKDELEAIELILSKGR